MAKIIKNSVTLQFLYLKQLPPILKDVHVHGSFNCAHNKLINLENSPLKINLNYGAYMNKLTSLQGCTSIIPGNFECSHNLLTNLIGGPTQVDGTYY